MSIADLLLMEITKMETKQKNMNMIKALLKEFESEFNTTKKFLKRVPVDQFDWAPHEKSMKMKSLASHIAELPAWVNLAFTTDGLDFATAPYEEKQVESNEDLLKLLTESYESGRAELEKASEEDFDKQWILRNGEQILGDLTKYEMMRIAFSQTTHHRAQLGVYLRLLNIPIPGSYGPSADDQSF
ncbi:damage-inducible protein DinB [Pedobacter yonginense]|uniref:Damage-inducible protein DinB n=1 Tax=Pedobacter yonginense TaxID=651869 RepID=A0A317ELM1_9SPHI|nr:DinB family protein [Pedobacter yonginense]PWS27275.1 damage-inducible protein DinB [Pedobacter yonginense]